MFDIKTKINKQFSLNNCLDNLSSSPIFYFGADYPSVLRTALDGKFDSLGLREMEEDLIKTFSDKSLSSTWREGTIKSSFNYLLLDSRVTQDLPNRADNLGNIFKHKLTTLDRFADFLFVVFF